MINGANLPAYAELLGVGREGCHDRGNVFEIEDEEPGDLTHLSCRAWLRFSVEGP
jgi:hypothetical protein